MSEHFIDGPAGKLEAVVSAPASGSIGAVLCHPHPQYGGSMNDMVLQALEDALLRAGVTSLRFNFRGTGASEGQHDQGAGEADDVVAAADWLRSTSGCNRLLLCGYSFGGAMSLAAAEQVQPDAMILVAPAVSMASFQPPSCPTLAVAGDDDQFFGPSQISAALDTATVEIISGADHFFFGHHGRISELAARFLQAEPWN